MSAYEAMVILKSGLSEEEQKALIKRLEDILKENQGKIEDVQLFGKRTLAYEIKKCKEGVYYLINFSTPEKKALVDLKSTCHIDENVLRVLVVKK